MFQLKAAGITGPNIHNKMDALFREKTGGVKPK